MYETLLEETNDIVIITDAEPLDEPDGPRIVYVNKSFCELTGYTKEDVIGKTPRILQGPATDTKTLAKIRESLNNQEAIRVELLNYAKNGDTYWLDFAITPLYDAKGKLVHFAAIERNVSIQKELEAQLLQKAYIDPLTNIHNRHLLFERGEELIHTMHRHQEPFGLIIIDIDDFKKFNDSRGHLEGDKILCKVADLCKIMFRKSDLVCRYGGDEFVVLVERTNDPEDIKLKAQLFSDKVQTISNNQFSVSIGGTLATVSDSKIDDVLKRADQALYDTKARDKGWVKII